MPPETYTLREILADANAYFTAGDAHGAVAVLFEGLDQFESQDEDANALRIRMELGNLCNVFWARQDFERCKEITALVLDSALRRAPSETSTEVEADYLALYVQAAAMTGTSPFPIQRLYRHRNLIRVFCRVKDRVAGDVAECGCARGLSFTQLCLAYRQNHAAWRGEGFHVFDSFQGLSEPDANDFDQGAPGIDVGRVATNRKAGNFAVDYDMVKTNIHRLFPNAELHPGWIPAAFAALPERSYSFVHVDVDLYQPTLDSLRYFFPRLAPGGVIITDDYNWPGARRAFDEFFAAQRQTALTTDTSQAYVIKST